MRGYHLDRLTVHRRVWLAGSLAQPLPAPGQARPGGEGVSEGGGLRGHPRGGGGSGAGLERTYLGQTGGEAAGRQGFLQDGIDPRPLGFQVQPQRVFRGQGDDGQRGQAKVRRMRRLAVSPSMTGMRISISTTS